MLRIILAISALFFVAPASFTQTTIVVYRTDGAIYAAADSKATYPLGGDGPSKVCKFFKVGEIFYGISGLYFHEYSQMVSDAKVTPANIRGSIADFKERFVPWLENVLEESRVKTPKEYEDYLHSKKPEIDFTFFGMKGKFPVVAAVSFKVYEDAHEVPRVSATPTFLDQVHCPNAYVICGAETGNWKDIKKYRAANPDWWMAKDLAGEMKKFVQVEIAAVPKHVGPPIRVLMIDANGLHWVEHGKGCDF